MANLFINGYIHSLEELKSAFDSANKDTNSPIYQGIEEAICENRLIEWVNKQEEQELDRSIKESITEICNNVLKKQITIDDGIKQISNVLDIDSNREWQKYISFIPKSFVFIPCNDNLTEYNNSYLYKRDDCSITFKVSVDYNIIASLDLDFYFQIKIIDLGSREMKDIKDKTFSINTKNIENEKQKNLSVSVELDLPEGEYYIALCDANDKSRAKILLRNLIVQYFTPQECIKIKRVTLTNDKLFKHKRIEDTFIAIENNTQTVTVDVECEIVKKIKNYDLVISLRNEKKKGKDIVSNYCMGQSCISENIDINEFKVGIYYLTIQLGGIVLNDNIALYITGGKRRINITKQLSINFIEVVDKYCHYLVSEKHLTVGEVTSITSNKITCSGDLNIPMIFKRGEKDEQYQIFEQSIYKNIRNIDKDKYLHILDNCGIDCDYIPQDNAIYAQNSDGFVHQVGTMAPSPLGIYDICGNVWTRLDSYETNDSQIRRLLNLVFTPDFVKVYGLFGGGDYQSESEMLGKIKKIETCEYFSYGIRLIKNLAWIQDTRKEKESQNT